MIERLETREKSLDLIRVGKGEPLQVLKIESYQGTWVAQLVKHPTSAQVMIS